jgi:hypothetical protein
MISKLETKRIVWLFATPAELRHLADLAERKLAEAELGDSLTVCTVGDDSVEVRISAAQE